MNALISAAIGNRVFANLLMAGMIVAGVFSMFTLTVKAFPDIATGAIQVTVPYPGATPREVSDAIVEPIESKVRTIEGVRKISAAATPGAASITVSLTRGADTKTLRDEIEMRIGEITVFPEAADQPIVTELEPNELALQFVIAGDIPASALKAVARQARQDLLALEAISSVEVSGTPVDEISVEVPQDRLRALNFGLPELAQRIGERILDLSAGVLISEQERTQVRTLGERDTGAELARIPIVESPDGSIIHLADIATVEDGLSNGPQLALLDGQSAVFVSVFRKGNEQTLALVDATRNYLDSELRPRLPDSLKVVEWRNEAESLRGRIELLSKNAVIGAGLILLLLTLALDLRIAAWVAGGIVVSFLGAFALMQVFGITINQLSLFGFILALGIVVDDAIVVGESVYSQRRTNTDSVDAAVKGATRMSRPVFYAVTTTIVAFLPLLILPGASGSFIAPVAAVVIMVLAMSLLESFFVLPHHLAHISNAEPGRYSPRRLADWLRDRVGGRIEQFADGPMRRYSCFSARQPVFVILVCFGLFAASLSLLTSGAVRFVFFPEIEGDFVAAQLELPSGVSEQVTRAKSLELADAARQVAADLAESKGLNDDQAVIRSVATTIGFASATGGPAEPGSAGANTATVDVKLQGAGQRQFSAGEFASRWRDRVGEIPGARKLSFSASLVGVGAPISLQVSAATEPSREAAVARVRQALGGQDGVYAIRDTAAPAAQEITIELLSEAYSLGVPVADVARNIRAAIFGATAARILRDDEEVDIRVRLPDDERETLADLNQFRVPVGGDFIPLSTLARLSVSPAPTTINRVDTREITTVEADVQTSLTTGAEQTRFIREQILPQIQQDYPSVTIQLGGEQEEQGRFGPALAKNFVLALFAIYALLAMAFQSYLKPVLILGTIFFGFTGALIGHALLGLNLTLLSMFGVVGLSGIVINSSLLMLDEIGDTVDEDDRLIDRISEAAASRFRPIFLTTLTTFFGIGPLILEDSLQAQFLIPTAVSLGFGVIAGAAFILTIVPAYASVYYRIKRSAYQRSKRTVTES